MGVNGAGSRHVLSGRHGHVQAPRVRQAALQVTAFALVAIDDNENSVTISDGGTLSPSQFAVLLRQALDEETMTAPAPEREADGDG